MSGWPPRVSRTREMSRQAANSSTEEFKPSAIVPRDADRPPLRVDDGGVARIGNTRASLDLIVERYEHGMTPEDMVRAYDTLALAGVHAAIACYLRHKAEVRVYLQRRQEEAE